MEKDRIFSWNQLGDPAQAVGSSLRPAFGKAIPYYSITNLTND